MEALQSGEQRAARLEAEHFDELWTAEEDDVAQLLHRYFHEAYWLNETGQFPDGECLQKQHRLALQVWMVFKNSIQRRMMGDTGKTPDGEDDDDGERATN